MNSKRAGASRILVTTLVIAIGALVVLALVVGLTSIRGWLPGQPGASATALATTMPSAADSGSPTASATADLPADISSRILFFNEDSKFVAATVDGGARFDFPADEIPLNADLSWVVSQRHSDGGDELVVRDALTGEVRHEHQTSQRVFGSAIVDGYLYWSQDSRTSAQDEIVKDGGVWRLLLPDGKAESIYTPSADAPSDATLDRARLAVSPTGATVATTLCQSGSCTAQVFDVVSGTQVGAVAGLVGLVTDDVVIVLSPNGSLSGYQFEGKLLWEIKADLVYELYLIRDGAALVTSIEGGAYPNYRYQVLVVDALTGATTEAYGRGADEQPWFLVAALSTDKYAALVGDVGVSDAIHQGLRDVALLDLESDAPKPVIYSDVLPAASP